MPRMVCNSAKIATVFLSLLPGVVSSPAWAQSDPRAILEASANAMGGSAPSTSDVVASVTYVEGSSTRSGTIHVVTRGLDQTSETIETQSQQKHVYNDGNGSASDNGAATTLSKERSVSTFSTQFPLLLIQSLLSDSDTAYEYVAADDTPIRGSDHVRVWNTYASSPELQVMTPVTVKDLWFDKTTNLLIKLIYRRYQARGASFPVPIEVVYSDYRASAARLYPFHIEEALNGTPWATIDVTSIVLESAVSDAAFNVE